LSKNKKVIVVQFSSSFDGSAKSCLLLSEGLEKNGWKTLTVFSKEGPIIEIFENSGLETMVIKHNNWLRRKPLFRFIKDILFEIRSGIAMYKSLRSFQPDIIYVNTVASFAGVVFANVLRKPLVWHIRELPYFINGEMKFPMYFFNIIKKIIYFSPSGIVTPTQLASKYWFGAGRKTNKIFVVSNAVDDEYLSRKIIKKKFSSKEIIIGVPGSLRKAKGHIFLLETINEYFANNPAIKFKISGDGPFDYVQKLKDFIAKNDLTKKIEFTGTLTDMIPFYDSCDFIVIPSKAESFGRTIIESFAREKPVIATNSGGIPEIIHDGVNGILVPYNDKSSLAEAIIQMIENKELREKLTVHKSEFVKSQYVKAVYQEKINQVCNMVYEA
jgi:glycosyltransferase involved in cell wall biosynthesis